MKVINLKALIESQRVQVLNDFKTKIGENEEQAFQDFKLKLENIERPEIIIIDNFIRPRMYIFLSIFDKSEVKNNITIKVDSDINHAMDFNLIMDQSYEVDELNFVHSITGNGTTNDFQIIPRLNIDELFSFTEIVGTAAFLIGEDLKGNGPLHEPNITKDRNVNVGYCLIKGKVCIMYIERIKLIMGQKREYHIHYSLCPRLYKPNRHVLSLK